MLLSAPFSPGCKAAMITFQRSTLTDASHNDRGLAMLKFKSRYANLAKQSASEVPTLQKGLTDPNSCMTCTHSMSGSQFRCSRTNKDKCNFFAWSHEPAVISTGTTGTMSMDDNTTRDSTTPAHTSHYHDSQPVSTSPVHLGQSHSSSLVSMSHEEMWAKISLLMAQLMEKEEEIRVAMHWKEEAEAKLEDIKDVFANSPSSLLPSMSGSQFRCSRTNKDKCNFFAWSHKPAVISTGTTGTMSMDDNTTRNSTTPAHTSHYHDSQPLSTSPVHLGQSHSSSLVSMSHEEMWAKISLLMAQLMEKEEEIRVAMHWKEEAEAKLEDRKDVLRSILDH
ncbi:hypothetical protein BS47DRAFT_1364788 [Hydnum rufescens UP504]|uniref:Uncharacterized protein n=1 Tax=Hydnum rufescens UP504 TaxID=1448309 RepID=A0A9P6AQM6_9AGAM|nr:hypothetical protein BS47DRAFT_1364788 [Hydnum rufescens UP504]